MFGKRKKEQQAAASTAEQVRSTIGSRNDSESWEKLGPDELRAVAFSLYTKYGQTCDPAMQPEVRRMHSLLVQRLPDTTRLELQQLIAQYIDETGASGELALLPFILGESSLQIISTTVIDYCMIMDGDESVDMPGPDLLISQYTSSSLPDKVRLGILAGMILLGDERLLPFVLGRWSDFEDPEDRRYLTTIRSGFVSTLQVEFMLDWLESTEDESEVGAIAGALAMMPLNSIDGVVTRLERSFPHTRAAGENPIRVLERWDFAEYGQSFLATRLGPVIDGESEPKVLPVVIEAWSQ